MTDQELILHQQQRIAALESQQQNTVLAGALSGALGTAGVSLRPGVMPQIEALLKPELSVVAHQGQAVVVGPGLKPVDQFVRERLASQDFSHFLQTGQGAAPGQHQGQGAAPKNMGEQIIAHAQAMRASAPMNDPRLDVTQSFGLKRK